MALDYGASCGAGVRRGPPPRKARPRAAARCTRIAATWAQTRSFLSRRRRHSSSTSNKIECRNGQGHFSTILFPQGFPPVFVVPTRMHWREWGRGIEGGSGNGRTAPAIGEARKGR